MTRHTLNRTLRRCYWLLTLVLLIALGAKLAPHIPAIAGTPLEHAASDVYEYLKDMTLVFITVVAAYLANVFQMRSKFVESLEEVWRSIVATKSSLYTFCEKQYPSSDDYLAAFCHISETIDNMRIVYKNSGETDELVGLYPYAPLHDMRRALQSIDPRKRATIPTEERKLVRDAILQSFYALRENFLEELDLKEPAHPILIAAGRRAKKPGSTAGAKSLLDWQRRHNDGKHGARPDIDDLLMRLYQAEHANLMGGTGNGSNGPVAPKAG